MLAIPYRIKKFMVEEWLKKLKSLGKSWIALATSKGGDYLGSHAKILKFLVKEEKLKGVAVILNRPYNDFVKRLDVTKRRKLQDEILNLPELPTTTIGSFPQTKDVRLNRLDHKKGRIETSEYNENIRQFVREAVYIQEKILEEQLMVELMNIH